MIVGKNCLSAQNARRRRSLFHYTAEMRRAASFLFSGGLFMTEERPKDLLSGNEAIARGAWEAGVTFASGYPGSRMQM